MEYPHPGKNILARVSDFYKHLLKAITCCCTSLYSLQPMAQAKQVVQNGQLWPAFFHQGQLSNRWGVQADVQFRTEEALVQGASQFVFRIGAAFFARKGPELSAGYAFFNFFPAAGHSNISRPEHRPWQQLQWQQSFSLLSLQHRIRMEQRFRRHIASDDALAPGYNFNFRLRYQLQVLWPLSRRPAEKRRYSLVASEEVMVNFGKEVVYNYFDQNRIFAGVQYRIDKHHLLEAGYMHLFQQLSSGNRYKIIHGLRVALRQHIDWRKNKSGNKE